MQHSRESRPRQELVGVPWSLSGIPRSFAAAPVPSQRLPRGTHWTRWEGTLGHELDTLGALGLVLCILGALGRAVDTLGGHTGLNFVFSLLNIYFPFQQGLDKDSSGGKLLFSLPFVPPQTFTQWMPPLCLKAGLSSADPSDTSTGFPFSYKHNYICKC